MDYAICRYAEKNYAECRHAGSRTLLRRAEAPSLASAERSLSPTRPRHRSTPVMWTPPGLHVGCGAEQLSGAGR